jgi:hypothetical protein
VLSRNSNLDVEVCFLRVTNQFTRSLRRIARLKLEILTIERTTRRVEGIPAKNEAWIYRLIRIRTRAKVGTIQSHQNNLILLTTSTPTLKNVHPNPPPLALPALPHRRTSRAGRRQRRDIGRDADGGYDAPSTVFGYDRRDHNGGGDGLHADVCEHGVGDVGAGADALGGEYWAGNDSGDGREEGVGDGGCGGRGEGGEEVVVVVVDWGGGRYWKGSVKRVEEGRFVRLGWDAFGFLGRLHKESGTYGARIKQKQTEGYESSLLHKSSCLALYIHPNPTPHSVFIPTTIYR